MTNANDGGPGSLRQAIADAAPGDAINFAPDVRGAILLTSGELSVGKDLSITGPGAGLLSVGAGSKSRVFNVAAGARVAVSGLTISNGAAPLATVEGGGAILNAGSLTLSDCALVNNTTNSRRGGAVANKGTLTINRCTLSGNSSFDDSGGAVFNDGGDVTINDSELTNNRARLGSPGGAIFNSAGSLVIRRSRFSQNSGGGGGGAALFSLSSDVEITDATFTNNFADGSGGAVHAEGGRLRISDSTFANNDSALSFGGGIFVKDIRDAEIVNSSIIANSNFAGGGLNIRTSTVRLTGSTIARNRARAASDGGGISFESGELSIDRCTLSNNSGGAGSGVHVSGGTASIKSSTIVSNTSGMPGGGALQNAGGAVHISNSVIALNRALPSGVVDVLSAFENLVESQVGVEFVGTPLPAPAPPPDPSEGFEGAGSAVFNEGLLSEDPAAFNPDTEVVQELIAGTTRRVDNAGSAVFDDYRVARPTGIGFRTTNFAASEKDRTVTLTLARTGDVESRAEVGFAVGVGGTPFPSGTFLFAEGQREAAFTVANPLPDDTLKQGDRTLALTLLPNAKGGALVPDLSTAALTITDDETTGNKIDDDPVFFTSQQYCDFLGRAPDAPGLAFWSSQFDHCALEAGCIEREKVHVSGAFFLSIEFQETGYVVYRAYQATLGRTPLRAEFLPDTRAVRGGVIVNQGEWRQELEANKRAFLDAWVQRPAFKERFDALNSGEYVDALYRNAGVPLPTGRRTELVLGLLTGQTTRRRVFGGLLDSKAAPGTPEASESEAFRRAHTNRAFVLMQYLGYLQRDPDADGFRHWLDKLDGFGGDFVAAEMVKAFVNSDEYRRRFEGRQFASCVGP